MEPNDLDGASPLPCAAVTVAPSGTIVQEPLVDGWQRLQSERQKLDLREETMIRQALADAAGVVAQAARTLGLARTTLASRIDQLGVRSSAPR
jgi:transcriptional regulator with GAF, ATPase, and Fis domain